MTFQLGGLGPPLATPMVETLLQNNNSAAIWQVFHSSILASLQR